MILDSMDKFRGHKKRPDIDAIFDFFSKTVATNIDKDTRWQISYCKTPSIYDSLYLSNVDQREIEPKPETKLDRIDDDSVQTLIHNTQRKYLNSQSKQKHPCYKISNKQQKTENNIFWTIWNTTNTHYNSYR